LGATPCPEAADVLTSNGIEGKVVVAMDADERTLEGIRQGVIHATVAQRPFTMAYTGLRLLADLYRYPPRAMETEGSLSTVPEVIDTGAVMVTADNLNTFVSERQALRAAAEAPAE
jgi:ribose transport system substrate-binding protein